LTTPDGALELTYTCVTGARFGAAERHDGNHSVRSEDQ
jgi:hypothetical protein